jgi:hypothetical protein
MLINIGDSDKLEIKSGIQLVSIHQIIALNKRFILLQMSLQVSRLNLKTCLIHRGTAY